MPPGLITRHDHKDVTETRDENEDVSAASPPRLGAPSTTSPNVPRACAADKQPPPRAPPSEKSSCARQKSGDDAGGVAGSHGSRNGRHASTPPPGSRSPTPKTSRATEQSRLHASAANGGDGGEGRGAVAAAATAPDASAEREGDRVGHRESRPGQVENRAERSPPKASRKRSLLAAEAMDGVDAGGSNDRAGDTRGDAESCPSGHDAAASAEDGKGREGRKERTEGADGHRGRAHAGGDAREETRRVQRPLGSRNLSAKTVKAAAGGTSPAGHTSAHRGRTGQGLTAEHRGRGGPRGGPDEAAGGTGPQVSRVSPAPAVCDAGELLFF